MLLLAAKQQATSRNFLFSFFNLFLSYIFLQKAHDLNLSRNKKLLGVPGIATRSKDATSNKSTLSFSTLDNPNFWTPGIEGRRVKLPREGQGSPARAQDDHLPWAAVPLLGRPSLEAKHPSKYQVVKFKLLVTTGISSDAIVPSSEHRTKAVLAQDTPCHNVTDRVMKNPLIITDSVMAPIGTF